MPTNSLDALYRRVAKKVLTETLGMKKGDSITVETWNNGLDFAKVMVSEARAMGCPTLRSARRRAMRTRCRSRLRRRERSPQRSGSSLR